MGEVPATRLEPLIASEVHLDRETLLSGETATDLRALLFERGVLVFRDLDISQEEQRQITATLGTVQPEESGGGLQKVTIDERLSPEYAAHFANTLFWHVDGPHGQTTPCLGGSFRPETLAPEGGETEFLNCYAAYEGLSKADQDLIDGLEVMLSAATSGLSAIPDASDEQVAKWRSRPTATQPLVWEHQSGRKSLMLGVPVTNVVGMHPADSYDLLCRLRAHMNHPDYVYRHEWRENDLLIWDNSGTMHRARPFDPACGRLLHRFTLEGEEPIRAPARA